MSVGHQKVNDSSIVIFLNVFNLLVGHALNKAIQFWPEADVVYWTDGRVWTWHKEDIIKFKGKRYTLAPRSYPCDVSVLKRGKKFGIEWSTDSIAHGNNSGAAAINLAIDRKSVV